MRSQAIETRQSDPSQLDVDRFLADPVRYFDCSRAKFFGVRQQDIERLHLAGLRRRFARLRGCLPMMDKLADLQNVDRIDTLDDVLPLLFDHAAYKSYPPFLLEKHRYAELTSWLSKLTTIDLSGVDVSGCRSLDDWLTTLQHETPITVHHTSGTTGSMSFLPSSKAEWRKALSTFPLMYCDDFGPETKLPLNIDCIYPHFRHGNLLNAMLNDVIVEVIAGAEGRMHAAYPGRLSADVMVLAARRRAAAARGKLHELRIDPELLERLDEFVALQRDMPNHIAAFFETMRRKLAGKRVFVLASSSMLYPLAADGLQRGLRRLFAPNSVVITGGGGKGIALPLDWEETVKEFFGIERLYGIYGMSEMSGQFVSCTHGNYHGSPWLIPYVLDDDNRPLSRHGRVTGRFAFFDLMAETHWGGFITGDEVTFDWDGFCPCGQASPYVVKGSIRRFSEKAGNVDEEKISCAAAPQAYAEALDFLNDART